MAIRLRTSSWRGVNTKEFALAASNLNRQLVTVAGLLFYETPVSFKDNGGLIDEAKIKLGAENSAGLSIKGHYPAKNGLFAGLHAAETVARGTRG